MWLRLMRALMAVMLALAPSLAHAKPNRKVDGEVRKVCRRAEKMLDALEYERARALLESSVRKRRNAKARPRTKANLWALLGRARAELGDAVGSDEAFLEAVRWDRRVKLSRSTSPKIREALDRARALAPPPRAEPPPPTKPPPKAPPPKAPPPKAPPATKPPPPRAKPRPAPPPKPRTRPKRRRRPRTESSGRAATSGSSKRGRWVDFGIVGPVRPGATVQIVARSGGLPRRARLEARVRRSQAGPFERLRLTKSGTVAKADLVLDSPRLEVFVVARRGRKVLAQAGSEAEPRVIAAVSSAPPLAEAWSSTSPPPAAPPPPLPPPEPVATSSAAAPPPVAVTPPPPPPGAGDTSGLGATEITLLAVGGAVVVASVVTAVLLLATRTPRCDVLEGQGCVEVQVVPSSLLRF